MMWEGATTAAAAAAGRDRFKNGMASGAAEKESEVVAYRKSRTD
jgi:hypothetical protein